MTERLSAGAMRRPRNGLKYTTDEEAFIRSEWARLVKLGPMHKSISIGGKLGRNPKCILAKAERMGLYTSASVRHYRDEERERNRRDWGQREIDRRKRGGHHTGR